MKGKDIIAVSSFGVQTYYPIGQKLSINGENLRGIGTWRLC